MIMEHLTPFLSQMPCILNIHKRNIFNMTEYPVLPNRKISVLTLISTISYPL